MQISTNISFNVKFPDNNIILIIGENNNIYKEIILLKPNRGVFLIAKYYAVNCLAAPDYKSRNNERMNYHF